MPGTSRHLRDGAIICNSGHFNVELDLEALEKLARSEAPSARVRRGVHAGFRQQGVRPGRRPSHKPVRRRRASRLSDGYELRNQALAVEYMAANQCELEKRVYSVPKVLDEKVAKMKLAAMNVAIDALTPRAGKRIWRAGPRGPRARLRATEPLNSDEREGGPQGPLFHVARARSARRLGGFAIGTR